MVKRFSPKEVLLVRVQLGPQITKRCCAKIFRMSEKPKKETLAESLIRRAEKISFSKGESLGRGIEKEVHEHPDDTNKVVSVYHEDGIEEPHFYEDDLVEHIPHPEMDQNERNRYKRQFYLLKILNLLFPKNIPNVHIVGTEPRFIVRERISTNITPSKEDTSVKLLVEALESLGLDVDENRKNFPLQKNDEPMYLDTFLHTIIDFENSDDSIFVNKGVPAGVELAVAEKLKSAIAMKLHGENQKIANTYLERYKELIPTPSPE